MAGKRIRILPAWMKESDEGMPKSSESINHSSNFLPTNLMNSSDFTEQEKEQEPNTPEKSTVDLELIDKTRKLNSTSNSVHQQINTLSDDEDNHQDATPLDSPFDSCSMKKDEQSVTFNNNFNAHVGDTPSSSGTTSNNSKTSTDGTSSNSARKACHYGSSCYRKNPQHRLEFSHPDDADYVESPDSHKNTTSDLDSRPLCKYGAACYRKNPQHRLDFSHDVKKRKARPTIMHDLTSDEEDADGYYSDDYNPKDSETDDSFVTSDSMGSGESDFDPEDDDNEGEKAGIIKKKQRKKPGDSAKNKRKKKNVNDSPKL